MKRVISGKKVVWIVVTSDRDIADYAWASGSTPVSAGDFLKTIEKESPPYPDKEENDEEYIEPNRKGNPRKLSKKEKAVNRALSKL
ncbi:MAG: hypothetical protein A2Y97_12145 [Nitrospirae bacterium RBG_13_39_12]|nr:MAG: hypothetical protein A2Y97_12145 [Nitrospirae bacterium RBG_13_39_12]